jgi:hypothetical protein
MYQLATFNTRYNYKWEFPLPLDDFDLRCNTEVTLILIGQGILAKHGVRGGGWYTSDNTAIIMSYI